MKVWKLRLRKRRRRKLLILAQLLNVSYYPAKFSRRKVGVKQVQMSRYNPSNALSRALF